MYFIKIYKAYHSKTKTNPYYLLENAIAGIGFSEDPESGKKWKIKYDVTDCRWDLCTWNQGRLILKGLNSHSVPIVEFYEF